jgi:dihydrolipoamide dehydrogenase
MVKKYDMIVIGSGAGMNVGGDALQRGMKVALLEHGSMGGTCLNNGCIPTKILVSPADIIRAMSEAKDIGVKGHVHNVDFNLIMKRTLSFVDEGRSDMEVGISHASNMDWYKETGHFIKDYTMQVGKTQITAPLIIIASGSRQLVPKIPGLEEAGYIDNITVLDLKKPPKSLLIMGGGYIACEFGHFFSAIGTKVTIIGRNPRLLKNEEPEVSEIVKRRFSKYVKIRTGHEAVEVTKEGGQKVVHARNQETGKLTKFKADEIMLAVGRRSNADLLKPNATGVKTDKAGWITVNSYLETSKKGIYALGDALGKHMFRHTANYEAEVVSRNIFTDHKTKVDYHAVPHAVFGFPQVGGVGLTEEQAKAAGYENLMVGRAKYTDVTKGYGLGEEDSLVKVIVDGESRKILGAHIVGSEAADLVQQVVYLMYTNDQTYIPMARAQIIHPALSEVVVRAFGNMQPVGGQAHHHGHGHGHEHQH